jgi:hypothetical protein
MTLWPWLPPNRGDLLAIAFGVVIVATVVFGLLFRPWNARVPASGFGPDWDCTSVPKGEPICVKRPPAKNLPSN